MTAEKSTNPPEESGSSSTLSLEVLQLDGMNPRFGQHAGSFSDQSAVLDYIVENFGVDTLLSSLAYNGYFEAEPIIVKPVGEGTFCVIEGNRRLAACLVLAGDPRAKNQAQRTNNWRGKIRGKAWTTDTGIPVRIFSDEAAAAKLLPYLGVRHIVSSQPWDSYAKAKWIAGVIDRQAMTLEQISEVTGDKNRTIERLLEGYYFINQLIDNGLFKPRQSVRRGRGSNPDYPFSWIYTLLDNTGVRRWLNLKERNQTRACPVESNRLSDAADTIRFLYGDRNEGKNPSIADSREIGLLASALSDPNKRTQLRTGKTAREIDLQSRPAQDLLADQLNRAAIALSEANTLLVSGKLTRQEASPMFERAQEIVSLAEGVVQQIAIGGRSGKVS